MLTKTFFKSSRDLVSAYRLIMELSQNNPEIRDKVSREIDKMNKRYKPDADRDSMSEVSGDSKFGKKSVADDSVASSGRRNQERPSTKGFETRQRSGNDLVAGIDLNNDGGQGEDNGVDGM
jgi:hypothetical protein